MRKLLLGFTLIAFVVGLTTAGSVSGSTTTTVTTTVDTPVSVKPSIDLVCMQNAVTKRDNAVIAALDKYHASWKKALETRRESLVAAWQMTDRKERWSALRKAWAEFY